MHTFTAAKKLIIFLVDIILSDLLGKQNAFVMNSIITIYQQLKVMKSTKAKRSSKQFPPSVRIISTTGTEYVSCTSSWNTSDDKSKFM